jgi:hypothetical protein
LLDGSRINGDEKRREIKKHKTKATTDVKIQQRETGMLFSAEEEIKKRRRGEDTKGTNKWEKQRRNKIQKCIDMRGYKKNYDFWKIKKK